MHCNTLANNDADRIQKELTIMLSIIFDLLITREGPV